MRPSGRKLLALALFPALGLAACSDDSGTNPTVTLQSPTNVEVRALSPTAARVTWDGVTGATGYEIERAEGAAGGTFTSVGTASSTTLDVTGLTTGGQYRFRVTATAGTNRSTASNPSSAFTVPDEIFSIVTSDITSNRTFYADSTYVLSGFIKVANNATLTIQPGTKIVGDFEIPGSSLFVLRGARIMAEGTADKPIVFTSERPAGQRQPGDWGGVIIIGNGIINRQGSTQIEGTGTPANANPAQFYHGGSDNNDSSGVLRYVRIEFAGYPTAPNEELNSLTMAAVGAGTTVEYVQVLQGLDDSFEWFGGAVNGRYLVSYESADDHFDASEGYIGRNQFLIAFQSIRPEARPGLAGGVASDPQGIENDGCWAENCAAGDANRSASQPYTVPVFANFTLVGAPAGAWETTGGNYGMMLRRGTGGLYVNGVVTRYSREAISLRGEQTMARHNEGNLRIRNLYISGTAGAFQAENLTAANLDNRQYVLDLAANALEVGDVAAANLFTVFPANTLNATGASFDWRPAAGSPIATGGLADFGGLPAQLQAATQINGRRNSTITPTS
ncbi:MAG TPA: fibronectin type III domain-containing protein [Longimicrobiales bacterium]|nr:fibronectin type III domain-containing protein [Longimicrobiales bacterium]